MALMPTDLPDPVVPATRHMGHFGQIGHHGVAHDVLAQAHGEHAFGFVIDLRTQNFSSV
jgi:hypothetical protein